MPNFSLCVYCGSRPGIDARYAQAARDVGTWIGQHGGQLVYGGGQNGLMGIVADATSAAGGSVVGIIPQFMVEREWARPSCDELHIVGTMHERKARLSELADGFVVLPGGFGTLDELFEAVTLVQTQKVTSFPVALLGVTFSRAVPPSLIR